jgi:outer membrane protein assembly factor BamB
MFSRLFRSSLLVFLAAGLGLPGAATAASCAPLYPENPVLAGDAVFVSHEGVVRFDSHTLKPSWRSLRGVNTFEVVVANSLLWVGSSRGLLALDSTTGKRHWQIAANHTLFSPSLGCEFAYAGATDGALRAVSLEDGQVAWRVNLPGWVYSPAVFGTTLVSGGQQGKVWGLDARTGDLRWEVDVEQELVYRPVAAGGDRVVVTTFSGEIWALASTDGSLIWRRRNPSPSFSPRVGQGRLYFGSFGGLLTALDTRSGEPLWRYQMTGQANAPTRLLGGVLLVNEANGGTLALESHSGHALWQSSPAGDTVGSPLPIDKRIVIFPRNAVSSFGVSPVVFRSPVLELQGDQPPQERGK